MRVSSILSSFRREFIGPIPKHKGNVLRGKKRFVPPVSMIQKIKLFQEMINEEETMKYLQKSYINEEQEIKYLEINKLSNPSYWDDFMRRQIQEPLPQTYCADFLEKFDVSRSFEEED